MDWWRTCDPLAINHEMGPKMCADGPSQAPCATFQVRSLEVQHAKFASVARVTTWLDHPIIQLLEDRVWQTWNIWRRSA